METATMNISLPESLKNEVEEIVISDGYGSASELFRELIRQHIRERQRKMEQEKLEAVLLERLNDADKMEFDIQQVKAELANRLTQEKK